MKKETNIGVTHSLHRAGESQLVIQAIGGLSSQNLVLRVKESPDQFANDFLNVFINEEIANQIIKMAKTAIKENRERKKVV